MPDERTHIIHDPTGPGPLRRCPACRTWFGLQPVVEEAVEEQEENAEVSDSALDRYCCARCGHEVGFVREVEPGNLHVRGR